jgi:hypothetical protein
MVAAGLLCGLGFKESKGARTLLALVAGVIPVHFAQLGALLLSQFGGEINTSHIPTYLLWTAPSDSVALLTVVCALAVLLPITYTAYAVLDRGLAMRLTVVTFLANASILIPVRDADVIALLGGTLLVAVALHDRVLASKVRFQTFESRLARLLMFSPVALLISRQLVLYSASEGIIAVGCFSAAAALLLVPARIVGKTVAGASQTCSSVPLAIGWYATLCAFGLDIDSADALFIPLFAIPLATGIGLASVRADVAKGTLQFIAALIASAATCAQLQAYPGVLSSSVSLGVSVALFSFAFMLERRSTLLLAAMTATFTACHHVSYIVEAYNFNSWITLGVAGIATIVGASWIERNFARASAALKQLRTTVVAWK